MNIEKEIRDGFEISTEMKRVWAVEMELLKKLLEVCRKYNLRIWAEGGTLLGAVRHKGFIPWDDDIDMAMPREDYDKLQAIAKVEFKYPFFFQSGYTDLFPNGQSKLRKDRTAAIIKADLFQKFHQGIFIDIFPLDILPDDDEELKKFLLLRNKEKNKLKLYCEHYFSLTNWKYNVKVLRNCYVINKIGFNNFFKRYDNFIKKYYPNKGERISIISWSDDRRYIRNRKWYDGTLFFHFEDILIPVPIGYHEILSKQYGDYMKPINVASQHGSFLILDTEHSFLDYLPKLRKGHRWDSWKVRLNTFKSFFQNES